MFLFDFFDQGVLSAGTAAAALIASVVFLFTWWRLPACWLFDTNRRRPHPKAGLAHRPAFIPGVFLCFFALSAILRLSLLHGPFSVFSGKVAEIGDFEPSGPSAVLFVWLLTLFLLLSIAALTDLFYRLIPDQVSIGIALLGVIRIAVFSMTEHSNLHSSMTGAGDFTTILSSAFPILFSGLTLCTALTLCMYLLPKAITGRPAMGLGDIKLLYALAVTLPPGLYVSALIRTALLGGIAAAGMILAKRTARGVPYATVLTAGVLWTMFF